MGDYAKTSVTRYRESLAYRGNFVDLGLGDWTTFVVGEGSYLNNISFSPYSLPDWKTRIRDRTSATTSMVVSRHKITTAGSSFFKTVVQHLDPGSDYGRQSSVEIRGDLAAELSSPVNVALSGYAEDQAREAFIRSAIKAQRQVMTGVIAGDLGKTLRMIRHPLRTLYRGFSNFLAHPLKGVPGSGRKRSRLKGLSDIYLEKRFGWDNLMLDINDLCSSLPQILTFRLPGKFISGRGLESGSYDPGSFTIDIFATRLRLKRLHTSSKEVRLRGFVKIFNESNSSTLSSTAQSLGLLPRDFLPTVWELIPYSFVVDYFTNVSSIIDSLTFNWSDIGWAEENSKTSDLCQILFEDFYTVPSTSYRVLNEVSQPGNVPSHSIDILSRKPLLGIPIPSLRFEIPGLGLKWLNLAALLASGRRSSSDLALYR